MDVRMTKTIERELKSTMPVYGHLPFTPVRAAGCDIVTDDGRRILDMYGGHAVAALGYGHPKLSEAIRQQSQNLLFQSNMVALDVRAEAAEKLLSIAPSNLASVFFVNSGAEANENALKVACRITGRRKVLAITHGFHGRTAAASAVTWNSDRWYGFPNKPFDVEFIERNNSDHARELIDDSVAAVIFEPVQGVAGGFDLSEEFQLTLRAATAKHGALLIADEVQSGMGRSGHFFAVQAYSIEPDLLTSAKSLGGGFPCGALMASADVTASLGSGDLGTTFGGGPVAAAAIIAVIDTIREENLLQNVRDREAEIRETCVTGPIQRVQGMGLLLGLICDRPAREVRDALLEHDVLAGLSADPHSLRILAPLVIQSHHIKHLSDALASIPAAQQ